MKRMQCVVLCLCLMVVCLAACGQNGATSRLPETDWSSAATHETDPQPTESQPESTQLPTTQTVTGTLLTERLTVAGDYSRSHETSAGRVWEVENGFYYLSTQRILHYADKTNLSIWVPVCSKPDCAHDPNKPNERCDAMVDQIMVIGDRIYRPGTGIDDLFTLYSTALDGTDLREEFTFTEAKELMSLGAGSGGLVMTPEYLACYVSVMNQQGIYDFRVYTADRSGAVLQIQEERENMSVLMSRWDSGEGLWFNGTAITDDFSRVVVYRLMAGELTSVELTGLWEAGAFFDGQMVMAFRPGEGYFKTDLTTGEEIKLSEPVGQGIAADIALPNCIVESTLFVPGESSGTQEQEMWLFTGQQWMEVELPEELRNPAQTQHIRQNVTVASDRILLELVTEGQRTVALYQILLTTDTPTLEYLGPIG
ncbi:MAG: hypothetical protein E7459_04485 [Ruminococcaceae bacterium]|nr:hypothetical protein [Oscillospiraceae bacterium]